MRFRYILLVAELLALITALSANYISYSSNGERITRMRFNLSMYIKDFLGTVFYAYDSKNMVLIRFQKTCYGAQEIVFQLNKLVIIDSINNVCGCNDCLVKHLTFTITLKENRVTVRCNDNRDQQKSILSTCSKSKIPKANSVSVNEIKSTVVLGDVDRYMIRNNISVAGQEVRSNHLYGPTLFGCLQYFNHNSKLKPKEEQDGHFLSSCHMIFRETKCDYNECTTGKVSMNVYNCSVPLLNEMYCRKKLASFIHRNISFVRRKQNENESVSLGLQWKQSNYKDYCLMEVQLRDGSFLTLSLSIFSVKIIHDINGNFGNYDANILVNATNILSLNFDNDNLVIKIFSGYNISTFIRKLFSKPVSFNVGFSRRKTCQPFQGQLNVRYDPSGFIIKSLYDAKHATEIRKDTHVNIGPQIVSLVLSLVLGELVVILLLSGAFVYLLVYYKKRMKQIKFGDPLLIELGNLPSNKNQINENEYIIYDTD